MSNVKILTEPQSDLKYAPIAKGVTNGDSHDHAGGDGAQVDHGGLGGLGDDDHTQYLNTTRHAAIDAADHGAGASTDGQVLTSDGAGGAAWEDPAGGGSTTTLAGRTFQAYVDAVLGTYPLAAPLFNKKARMYRTGGSTSFVAVLGCGPMTGTIATNTPITGNELSESQHGYYTTSTSANAVASVRTAYAEWGQGDITGGFFFVCRFGFAAGVFKTDSRFFIGLHNSTSALSGSTEPSAFTDFCGLGKDSTDGTFQFMCNDGSGAATKEDATMTSSPTTGEWYDFIMYRAPGGSVIYWELRNADDRTLIDSGSQNSNLPSTGQTYAIHCHVANASAGSATRVDVDFVYCEAPY